MGKFKTLCMATLLAGFAGSAYGGTVTATSNISTISDFTIGFTDANSDGLVEYSEIDSFSGFSNELTNFDFVYTTPTLSGVSIFGSFNTYLTSSTIWQFRETGSLQNVFDFQTSVWSYTVDPGPTGGGQGPGVVPLPASLPLLAGALGIFGLLRRRKAKA